MNKTNAILFSLLIGVLIAYYSCLSQKLFKHHSNSTVLYDIEGQLLSANISNEEQWHFPLSQELSSKYKHCVLQFEDKRFYQHPGYDPISLLRAIFSNLKEKRVVSGGSTITMQTIRLHSNNPPRTIFQKMKEIILATRLEWRMSKDDILLHYASHAPFGGNVIGIEAASWRYLGKSALKISWGEAALLAVLPNSPGLIHTERNRGKLRAKRDRLLQSLWEDGIIDKSTHDGAIEENIPHRAKRIPAYSPHLLQHLENSMGAAIYHTTLRMELQQRCLDIAQHHGRSLKENFIDNIAILVIDNYTNEVISYVGNLEDTGHKNQEFVDMVQAKRSTGSLLKPFLYAASMDEGIILEKSLLIDYPFPMNGFVAENYNQKHQGLVPANKALIRSLNIPFASLLQKYGIERFLHVCNKAGMQNINRSAEYYGIPLILGGAEESLWNLTNAYSMMAKTLNTANRENGYYSLDDLQESKLLTSRKAQVSKKNMNSQSYFLRAESIYTTLTTLQKLERPSQEGGWKSYENNRPIAWKTGTSNGFKDAWAIGVNSRYTVGIWVGNADGEGRPGIVGAKAAAPILFSVLNILDEHKWFSRPIDNQRITTTCSVSGNLNNRYCPVDSTWISGHNMDFPQCDNHQQIYVDQERRYRVSADCHNMSLAYAKSFFYLPEKVAYYYSQNALYEKIPEYHPNCKKGESSSKPSIIYPEQGLKIYLPRVREGIRNKLSFRSFHPIENMILYWHIDDKFVATTEGIHEINRKIEPGTHRLAVVDENGHKSVIEFEIIK